ncbi:MAG: GlcG/HbpS family heme-binding protein [Legionellaceae bacterium]
MKIKSIHSLLVFFLVLFSWFILRIFMLELYSKQVKETYSLSKDQCMIELTLKQANAIIEASFVEAKKLKLAPLSVVVLDKGGHLVAFQRQDTASILRFEIAFAKAYGALGMGMGSRGLAEKAKEMPDFMRGAIDASKGRLIPAPGGVLILNEHNRVIGAVGVSGDTSDHDERAAVMGIQSVGWASKVD